MLADTDGAAAKCARDPIRLQLESVQRFERQGERDASHRPITERGTRSARICIRGPLWRLSRGDRLRQLSTGAFGLSMVILYGASGAYHAVPGKEPLLPYLQKLDHSAIYVLIAGTYTPVFAVLLGGRLRVLLLSFLKGSAPMIAIEMGRRAIPAHVRPSFDEMEKHCKAQATAEAAAAA